MSDLTWPPVEPSSYEQGFTYDPQRDWWFCGACGCPVVHSLIPRHRQWHEGERMRNWTGF